MEEEKKEHIFVKCDDNSFIDGQLDTRGVCVCGAREGDAKPCPIH